MCYNDYINQFINKKMHQNYALVSNKSDSWHSYCVLNAIHCPN